MVNSENELHKRLTNYHDIAEAIHNINERINGCGFNFKEDSDGFTRSVALAYVADSDKAIIVLASFDFSYYHDLEMVFYNVSYSTVGPGYSWWDHWNKDQIEFVGEIEANDKDSTGFEFRFNRGTKGEVQYVIKASAFSYYDGHVSYR